MKIFFDYQIFYQQKYGGISNYFTCLALELTKLGAQIKIISPIHKNKNIEILPKELVFGKKLFYPYKLNNYIEKINNFLSNNIIKKENPEIVHKTYFSNKKISTKAKKIITYYDLTHELFSSKKNEKFIELKKQNAIDSDHIICPSNKVKQDIIEFHGFNPSKISVTYFSSDFKKINQLGLTGKKKLSNYLLFVGSRSGYKNFERFIKAFSISKKLTKDFKILVFGGENKKIEGVHLLKKYNLNENLIKFVYGTNSELNDIYKHVSALIYPTMYEGFGIPIIEAMRNGCPVICSNGGALREIGGEGLFYFEPTNVEDICHTIEKVVYSDLLLKKLVEYGFSRCDLFSWSKCAKETFEIYKNI